MLKCLGSELLRTAYRSPWQNGVAERWVGSCRRELLDHVIVLNEAHLHRMVREYFRYYHEDRIHDALNKDTPDQRPRGAKEDHLIVSGGPFPPWRTTPSVHLECGRLIFPARSFHV